MESVLTTKKGICYRCQKQCDTELHHIIHSGCSKKRQERMGLIVYLCADCHRGTYGVHGKYGHDIDIDLKKISQKMYEESHSRDEWMKEIGRNYLD